MKNITAQWRTNALMISLFLFSAFIISCNNHHCDDLYGNCDDTGEYVPETDPVKTNIKLTGTNFESHQGKMVYIRLTELSTAETIEESLIIKEDQFFINWQEAIISDKKYRADIYVDANEDNTCEFGTDFVASFKFTAKEDLHYYIDKESFTENSGGCEGFGIGSLEIEGKDFLCNGAYVYIALQLMTDETPAQVIDTQSDIISRDSFQIEFPGLLQDGEFYMLDCYIDLNGNKTSDEADYSWQETIEPVYGEKITLDISGEDYPSCEI